MNTNTILDIDSDDIDARDIDDSGIGPDCDDSGIGPDGDANADARFPFECACGERYSTIEAARCCRKCRVYLIEGETYDREVIDVRHGGIVWALAPVWDEEVDGVYPKARPFRATLADVWRGV